MLFCYDVKNPTDLGSHFATFSSEHVNYRIFAHEHILNLASRLSETRLIICKRPRPQYISDSPCTVTDIEYRDKFCGYLLIFQKRKRVTNRPLLATISAFAVSANASRAHPDKTITGDDFLLTHTVKPLISINDTAPVASVLQ